MWAKVTVGKKLEANESKADGERPWVPKKLKVISVKVHGVKGNIRPTPVLRDMASIMGSGVFMSDEQIKLSSCHGWNNGDGLLQLSPERKCYFSHVCNVGLSTTHRRSNCPKRSAKKIE